MFLSPDFHPSIIALRYLNTNSLTKCLLLAPIITNAHSLIHAEPAATLKVTSATNVRPLSLAKLAGENLHLDFGALASDNSAGC